MRWTERKDKKIVLDGIAVELETEDQTLIGIVLKDVAGRTVRIGKRDYGGILVFEPAAPPTKIVYRAVGQINGIPLKPVDEDSRNAAMEAVARISRAGGEAQIVEVEVPEEEE